MKPLTLLAVLVSLYLFSACSKKSSSSPDINQPGTSYLAFDFNGDSVYLTNIVVDTTRTGGANNSYFMIAGTAVMPNSSDHCMFNINMGLEGLPVTDYFGNYNSLQIILNNTTANRLYTSSDGNGAATLNITHNDGKTITGSFSGTVVIVNSDSTSVISNGAFSISL